MAEGSINVHSEKPWRWECPRTAAWCSLNPARYYGLDRLGAAAQGWLVDLVLVEDLTSFHPLRVWVSGRLVAEGGACSVPPRSTPTRPRPTRA
jgi:adenine deaminase